MRTMFLHSLAFAAIAGVLAPPAASQNAPDQARARAAASLVAAGFVDANQALRSVRNSTQPSMLVFTEPAEQGRIDINSLSKVRKLLQEEGLADLGINPVNLLQGETAES
ncbi:MAG: hypothetical protein LBC63_10915, partial [Holophagales bacterium]|nr:hypothetical protein [Holophagales bacterium]